MKKLLVRMARTLLLTVLALLGGVTGCQSKLVYFPRPLAPGVKAAFIRRGGVVLPYQTSQGAQVAYFLPTSDEPPPHLWVVTAGNGSLALDWLDTVPDYDPDAAWLFVDYPAYGECEGRTAPARVRENYVGALAALRKHLGWSEGEVRRRTGAFGQSLGAAAALDGAAEFGLSRVLALAPFTSMKDMFRHVAGWPLSELCRHRYDNRASLRRLQTAGAKVQVLHGTADEVIPVAQGRELARLFPQTVTYTEIEGGRHNDLPEVAPAEIAAAMAALREDWP